jgi:hypothetical protein
VRKIGHYYFCWQKKFYWSKKLGKLDFVIFDGGFKKI